MQFSIRRLFFLTAIVAIMFGRVGHYWPLGTAVAVVVCIAAGTVLLTFGTIRSWKLVVWTCAVFVGSLVGVRYALDLARHSDLLRRWPDRTVEACMLAAGAIVFGAVGLGVLILFSRRSVNS